MRFHEFSWVRKGAENFQPSLAIGRIVGRVWSSGMAGDVKWVVVMPQMPIR